jgi:hypothetical protein
MFKWLVRKMSEKNKNNLITNDKRTPSELREIAKKGGKASGKARREKRLFKDLMSEVLQQKPTEYIERQISQIFPEIDKELMTNKLGMVANLYKTALDTDSKQSVKAFEVIRDTIGEKPVEKVEVDDKRINLIKENLRKAREKANKETKDGLEFENRDE